MSRRSVGQSHAIVIGFIGHFAAIITRAATVGYLRLCSAATGLLMAGTACARHGTLAPFRGGSSSLAKSVRAVETSPPAAQASGARAAVPSDLVAKYCVSCH